jgi:hypothetical protein
MSGRGPKSSSKTVVPKGPKIGKTKKVSKKRLLLIRRLNADKIYEDKKNAYVNVYILQSFGGDKTAVNKMEKEDKRGYKKLKEKAEKAFIDELNRVTDYKKAEKEGKEGEEADYYGRALGYNAEDVDLETNEEGTAKGSRGTRKNYEKTSSVHAQCIGVLGPFDPTRTIDWLDGLPINGFVIFEGGTTQAERDETLRRKEELADGDASKLPEFAVNGNATPMVQGFVNGGYIAADEGAAVVKYIQDNLIGCNFDYKKQRRNGRWIIQRGQLHDEETCEHLRKIKQAATKLVLWIRDRPLTPQEARAQHTAYEWSKNTPNYHKNEKSITSIPHGAKNETLTYTNRLKLALLMMDMYTLPFGISPFRLQWRGEALSTTYPNPTNAYIDVLKRYYAAREVAGGTSLYTALEGGLFTSAANIYYGAEGRPPAPVDIEIRRILFPTCETREAFIEECRRNTVLSWWKIKNLESMTGRSDSAVNIIAEQESVLDDWNAQDSTNRDAIEFHSEWTRVFTERVGAGAIPAIPYALLRPRAQILAFVRYLSGLGLGLTQLDMQSIVLTIPGNLWTAWTTSLRQGRIPDTPPFRFGDTPSAASASAVVRAPSSIGSVSAVYSAPAPPPVSGARAYGTFASSAAPPPFGSLAAAPPFGFAASGRGGKSTRKRRRN